MKMKRNEEDEIQVLGTATKKIRGKWVMLLVACIAIVALSVLLLIDKDVADGGDADIARLKKEVMQESSSPTESSAVKVNEDSINDVPLVIYSLVNLKAELMLGLPNKEDSTILLAAQAADIRKENKGVVGDFILHGEQLSVGKGKAGYCAIIDGNVSLGISLEDGVKDYCIEHKGDFFRQYALVIEGEVQKNNLKGKAVRRTLARQGDDLYIIESVNRESLYDFSEALSDIGVTEAIYLVGGEAYMFHRDSGNGQLYEHGDNSKFPSKNTSYVIFRRK